MSRVTVVDYGMGNLLSVERALVSCGAEPERASTPEAIELSRVLVLPGVGAFGSGMAGLRERGLVEPLRSHVAAGRPLLGICLGMHMLFERSTEFGEHEGLGVLAGDVVALSPDDEQGRDVKAKVPHIGWSAIQPTRGGWSRTVLDGTPRGEFFYFVHSFLAVPADEAHRLADTNYVGSRVAAVVADGAVVGTQFHPEKSGPAGLRLLTNFLRLADSGERPQPRAANTGIT